MVPVLTGRELQILELIAHGHSAKEIAQQRGVTHRTVETQLDTMRLKLRARNRTHMVAIAMGSNLLGRVGDQCFDLGARVRQFGTPLSIDGHPWLEARSPLPVVKVDAAPNASETPASALAESARQLG